MWKNKKVAFEKKIAYFRQNYCFIFIKRFTLQIKPTTGGLPIATILLYF